MPKKKASAKNGSDCRTSGFMGQPIEQATAVKAAITGKLAEIGITDAEQLLAVAAIPDVREHLLEHLQVSNQELDAAVREARKAVPERVAVEVETPVPYEFGLGVLPPTPEMVAAAEYEVVELEREFAALPPNVNLIAKMPPIRNQASRGTCVAFTLTAIHDYAIRLPGGQPRNYSEQHLYYETKLIDGQPGGCGTWQAKGAVALGNRGQCVESFWAYNPNPPCNNHGPLPSNARPNGLLHRFRLVAVSPRNVTAIKTALAARKPVGISIPVYNSWYQSSETRRTGRLNMRIGNEPDAGGHAVCLVGYQDSATSPGGGYFILRNSWSTTWAYQSPYGAGYGTIPYQYIANENWESYAPATVAGEEEDEQEEPLDDTTTSTRRTITIRVKGNVNLIIE
jgi:Papain family cysteine protease